MNVLLVVLGGARADRLSCAGYERETTPFLDRLAREGVRYECMISCAPDTVSAAASLLTGLYPATHGATVENERLSPSHRSLAEYLKSAGYETAGFCTSRTVSARNGFGRGFDRFHAPGADRGFAERAVRYARRASDRVLGRRDSGARRANQALLDWLGACREPFLAFLDYDELWPPFRAPHPYDQMFMPSGANVARVRELMRDGEGLLDDPERVRADDLGVLQAAYDGALRYVDSRLQEVAEALVATGRWERTLVVVTADHGEEIGEHGMVGHGGGLYDTLLRVPLLLRCPSRLPGGVVVDQFAQSVDVLPTILQLAAVETDMTSLHGRPLFVNGQASAGPPFCISEAFRPSGCGGHARASGQRAGFQERRKAVRTRREKFVWHSNEANELYDLLRDPSEASNVIAVQPERAETLRRALFDWFASVERYDASADPAQVGPSAQIALRRIGQVE